MHRPADWPIDQADAVLSINMVHISPWAVGARPDRRRGAAADRGRAADPLRTVARGGSRPRTEQSRVRCRPQAPRSGLGPAPGRRFRRGRGPGVRLAERRRMPANNLMLLFRRTADGSLNEALPPSARRRPDGREQHHAQSPVPPLARVPRGDDRGRRRRRAGEAPQPLRRRAR